VAEQFLLRLLTPYKSVFEDQVEAVVVPGEGGEFGVLARHTKYITVMQTGQLRYVQAGKTHRLAVGGGFAEVYPGGVTVLADSLERPEEIDVERARENAEEARNKLVDRPAMQEKEVRRWEERLARSENRLKLAKAS